MKVLILLLFIVATVSGSSSVLDCNFNEYRRQLCSWSNDNNNWLINWVVQSDANQQRAVCLIPPINEKLLKLANNKPLNARLWSDVVFSDTKLSCLSFSYRFYYSNRYDDSSVKSDSNKLTIMRREMGSCHQSYDSKLGQPVMICANANIWNNSLSTSDWNQASIDIISSNSDFKLILEGTIPSGNPNAKICVDNITSSAEPCKRPPIGGAKSLASYHSWVELYGMTFAGALALGLTIPIAVFVVCLFERKRRRGKKNKRIIRHADELDLPEAMNTNSYEETNPLPSRYTSSSQVGVGNPRLMNRAMSTPAAGINGQGGNYTMGKRGGPPGQHPQQTSQMTAQRGGGSQYVSAHTMGRGNMEGGWMMSSQHGDLMENDEYTIDPDYTTHRQMSVPANGYIPAVASQPAMMNNNPHSSDQLAMSGQYRPIPIPQTSVSATTTSSASVTNTNNPFGSPVVTAANAGQVACSSGSVAPQGNQGQVAMNNDALPGLPFYPPRYEEAMGFNPGQHPQTMEEKPPLLPPRIPEGNTAGPSNQLGGPSSQQNGSTGSLPPAPPPLPLSGHPTGRYQGNDQQNN